MDMERKMIKAWVSESDNEIVFEDEKGERSSIDLGEDPAEALRQDGVYGYGIPAELIERLIDGERVSYSVER